MCVSVFMRCMSVCYQRAGSGTARPASQKQSIRRFCDVATSLGSDFSQTPHLTATHKCFVGPLTQDWPPFWALCRAALAGTLRCTIGQPVSALVHSACCCLGRLRVTVLTVATSMRLEIGAQVPLSVLSCLWTKAQWLTVCPDPGTSLLAKSG